MNKTILILPGIIFVIFVIIFFNLWSEQMKDSEWSGGAVIEPAENYIIKETDQGTVIENSNVGLTVKVPDEWNTEKVEIGIDEWIVNMTSKDATVNSSGLLEGGCGVSIGVRHDKPSVMAVEAVINNVQVGDIEESDRYEIIQISGRPGLKTSFNRPDWGDAIMIEIPVEDRIYMLDTLIINNTDCLNLFNQIIDGISID